MTLQVIKLNSRLLELYLQWRSSKKYATWMCFVTDLCCCIQNLLSSWVHGPAFANPCCKLKTRATLPVKDSTKVGGQW